MRESPGKVAQVDHLQIVVGTLFAFFFAHTVDLQCVGDVAPDIPPREKLVEFLEDHDAVRARLGDLFIVQQDTPFFRLLESGDRADQGALAAAGRPDDRHGLAVWDGEADAIQGDHGSVAA